MVGTNWKSRMERKTENKEIGVLDHMMYAAIALFAATYVLMLVFSKY